MWIREISLYVPTICSVRFFAAADMCDFFLPAVRGRIVEEFFRVCHGDKPEAICQMAQNGMASRYWGYTISHINI